MRNCPDCGGRLKRVHRTFPERFSYMAIYVCGECDHTEYVPRRWRYHLGETCRCPKCGTLRISKLKGPDKIDPMHKGPLNWFERMAGGSLYYCCFCRVQFFDRRRPAPKNGSRETVTTRQDTAKSGV
jgi:hypothetical protein